MSLVFSEATISVKKVTFLFVPVVFSEATISVKKVTFLFVPVVFSEATISVKVGNLYVCFQKCIYCIVVSY